MKRTRRVVQGAVCLTLMLSGCIGAEEVSDVAFDPGGPGDYRTLREPREPLPVVSREWGTEAVELGGGVLVRTGPEGLWVLDGSASVPRVLGLQRGYGEVLGRFGERGVVVRTWDARGFSAAVVALDLTRPEAPVERGRWPFLARAVGWQGERSWWAAVSDGVVRLDSEGVFGIGVVGEDEQVRWVDGVEGDEPWGVRFPFRRGEVPTCLDGGAVFCSEPVSELTVFAPLTGREDQVSLRWSPVDVRALLSDGVLWVVGTNQTDRSEVVVEALTFEGRQERGALVAGEAPVAEVYGLEGGRVALLDREGWVRVFESGGEVREVLAWRLPEAVVAVGLARDRRHLVAVGDGEAMVIDLLASAAGSAVVSRVLVPPREGLEEAASLEAGADGVDRLWVPRVRRVEGRVEAPVVVLRVEGGQLQEVGEVVLPSAGRGTTVAGAGRIGLLTAHDEVVVDVATLGVLGRVPLHRERQAAFEIGGHGLRHVADARDEASGAEGLLPDRIEVLAAGADLDLGEPVVQVEIPGDALVVRDGRRLVAWGLEAVGRARIEVYDFAAPLVPHLVGELVDEGYLGGLTPLKLWGHRRSQVALREGRLLIVDSAHDVLHVIDTRAEGGLRHEEVPLPDGVEVVGLFAEGSKPRLGVLEGLDDGSREWRSYLVDIDLGGEGTRLGAMVNVPGEVVAVGGERVLTHQQRALDRRADASSQALHVVRLEAGGAWIEDTLTLDLASAQAIWGAWMDDGSLVAECPVGLDHGAEVGLYVRPATGGWAARYSAGFCEAPRQVAGGWLLCDEGQGHTAKESASNGWEVVGRGRMLRVEALEEGWAVVGEDGSVETLGR